jgi:alkyl sulfatase BDS1-like metallo-beta-lactamase superfamily hydrolase
MHILHDLRRMKPTIACLLAVSTGTALAQQQIGLDDPLSTGAEQQAAVRINDSIFLAYGFGNTFMVTTSAGNVIIDTSSAVRAPRAKELLQRVSAAPIKYIVLTHGHRDHTGGVKLWRAPDTKIIAQQEHYELTNYQIRLSGFFNERNTAQFNYPRQQVVATPGNYAAEMLPTVLFDDKYEFTLGGVRFELYSTPGETPDHLTVWLPKYRAAFVGDNFYESFPNIYTLRGTKPRWALDYVNSLDKVLALKPEILLPSHGDPIYGNAEITRRLTQYRDAIRYVHDAVVAGMNAGKDVYTLMREIKLPPALKIGESYGNLAWSIRGIYEGYAGWFDLNPATMYDVPVSDVFPDLTRLAGGPDALVTLAVQRVEAGKYVEALHLTQIALSADPKHPKALQTRLQALEKLRAQSNNSNERGWLDYSIRDLKSRLSEPATPR